MLYLSENKSFTTNTTILRQEKKNQHETNYSKCTHYTVMFKPRIRQRERVRQRNLEAENACPDISSCWGTKPATK